MLGRTVSHYRILSKLGEGGMGIVYLAEDTHLGRQVALKFAGAAQQSAKSRARFLREARSASALNHPNIACIYDYGEQDGRPFIVMELVTGNSLSHLLPDGKLPLIRRVEIIQSVAEALREAHRLGIIHRDIKPSNVIVSERGEVKVLDFGLAKQVDEKAPSGEDVHAATLLATGTAEGVVVGTPHYMSPEQAKSAGVDARTDLFSLGVLLYEILTGKRPFSGGNAVEILGQVIHVDPAPPSQLNPTVPAELDRITMKALAKKPDDRYLSAEEFLVDLRAVIAMLTRADSIETQLLPSDASLRRHASNIKAFSLRSRLVQVLLALLIVVTAAGVSWRILAPQSHLPSAETLRWYQEGTNALRDGTYFKASKALEKAIAMDPSFALAHARLAEALLELDYTDKAREEMLRANPPGSRVKLRRPDELYLEAVHLTVMGDLAGAVSKYRENLSQAAETELPNAYVDLGRAFEKNEKPKEAIQSYEEAIRRSPQYAAALLRSGVLYARAQDSAKAAKAFDQADSLYRALSNIEGLTEVLYQRATAANKAGHPQEARSLAEQAITVARTAGNVNQQISALLQLSNVEYTLGETAQAQKSATEALDLARNNGLENLTTRGLLEVGNVAFVQGSLEQAKQYFNQALDYAHRFKTTRNEMRAMLSLASVLIQQGNLDEGVQKLQPALQFYEQGGYRREAAQALILLARAKRKQGDYEGALQASQQQLQLSQQMGNRALVALAEGSLGSILSEQQRFPEALAHFQEYSVVAQAMSDKNGTGYALSGVGKQLANLGRYDQAREALGRALAIAKQPGGDKSLQAQIHLNLAEMALSRRQFSAATSEARQALAVGSQDRDVPIGAERVIGISAAFAGNKAAASRHVAEAIQLAEKSGVAPRLGEALLTSAEVDLEQRQARLAAEQAVRAAQLFGRGAQEESEWRAWLIAGRAALAAGDSAAAKSSAGQAAAALEKVSRSWPAADFKTYCGRPDVEMYRKQLDQIQR